MGGFGYFSLQIHYLWSEIPPNMLKAEELEKKAYGDLGSVRCKVAISGAKYSLAC